eukprot:184012_1
MTDKMNAPSSRLIKVPINQNFTVKSSKFCIVFAIVLLSCFASFLFGLYYTENLTLSPSYNIWNLNDNHWFIESQTLSDLDCAPKRPLIDIDTLSTIQRDDLNHLTNTVFLNHKFKRKVFFLGDSVLRNAAFGLFCNIYWELNGRPCEEINIKSYCGSRTKKCQLDSLNGTEFFYYWFQYFNHPIPSELRAINYSTPGLRGIVNWLHMQLGHICESSDDLFGCLNQSIFNGYQTEKHDVLIVRVGLQYILFNNENPAKPNKYLRPYLLKDWEHNLKHDLAIFIHVLSQRFNGIILIWGLVYESKMSTCRYPFSRLGQYFHIANEIIHQTIDNLTCNHRIRYISPEFSLNFSLKTDQAGNDYTDCFHFKRKSKMMDLTLYSFLTALT